MKRIFALLLSLLMVFAFVACGDDDNSSGGGGGGGGGTPPEFNLADVMQGNGGNTVWGLQDAATKQSIIETCSAAGYNVSFGSDGSMTILETSTGNQIIQNADGTWKLKGADGSESQLGGSWPVNEFTAHLPTPNFELFAAGTDGNSFYANFKNASLQQIKAYVEAVKEKGFIYDSVTNEAGGFSYTAKNADGYSVMVGYVLSGESHIMLDKPDIPNT